MITIYHNPRCIKSREGLQIVEQASQEFEIVKYLDETLSRKELEKIILLLNIKPIELVRKNEAIWKDNYKNKTLTDSQVIDALMANPKLIERSIVVNNNKAIIGRPPELIKNIL